MRKKVHITKFLFGLALTLSGLTSAATAQSAAPRQNGKIAFTSDRDGNHEIYVMNADGTNQVRLTNNSVVDGHPTWSPNGTKIAFVSVRPAGGFAIFTMNADGTNKSEVTPISSDITQEYWGMSWSPDGSRLVFQDRPAPSASGSDLFIVNIDGSNRHVLVNDSVFEYQPAWSPDGSRILFTRQVSNNSYSTFYTVRPDGSDLRALPHFNREFDWESDTAPSWSPTGDKIAFTIFDWANFNSIGIANADGSNRQWFDDGNVANAGRDKPQWSPDGSKIVFNDYGERGTQIIVKNVDGSGSTRLTDLPGNNFNPSWQSLLPAACHNPIDCADLFVRQHYRDFLAREPDAEGLAFWTGEINSCGADAACVEVKRVNVSAAFFLSIEFQETGFYAIRVQRASFGRKSAGPSRVTLATLLPDAQALGANVVVGQGDWQGQLNANKQAYAQNVVASAAFAARFPESQTAAEYVAALYASADLTPTPAETDEAVAAFGAGGDAGRVAALRKVTESDSLRRAEFNPAFVLMEYFGYLRRDPDEPGYNFWLSKLNQFNGDYVQAEMVKAFISSAEYRARFGQP